MSEDHQKSRGVSPCRNRAQIGHGVLVSAPTPSEPASVSGVPGQRLLGPRASRPHLCASCDQSGDSIRCALGNRRGRAGETWAF